MKRQRVKRRHLVTRHPIDPLTFAAILALAALCGTLAAIAAEMLK